MALDLAPRADGDEALRPFPPGPLLSIGSGRTRITLAPEAGGRIARLVHDDVDWLVGYDASNAAMIAWGCFPMVPWAGRVRRGAFRFEGRDHRLPPNLRGHAIHGVGFALPWQVDAVAGDRVALSLALPADARWPFGGVTRQHIEVGDRHASMHLSITAGDVAMPASIGWHPWFRKPDRLEFAPRAIYPRDADAIAVPPPVAPTPGPWDDCFLNDAPVQLHLGGQRVRITSGFDHWVVYDETALSTCVEAQSGPPDAFNLAPRILPPGASLHGWFRLDWI